MILQDIPTGLLYQAAPKASQIVPGENGTRYYYDGTHYYLVLFDDDADYFGRVNTGGMGALARRAGMGDPAGQGVNIDPNLSARDIILQQGAALTQLAQSIFQQYGIPQINTPGGGQPTVYTDTVRAGGGVQWNASYVVAPGWTFPNSIDDLQKALQNKGYLNVQVATYGVTSWSVSVNATVPRDMSLRTVQSDFESALLSTGRSAIQPNNISVSFQPSAGGGSGGNQPNPVDPNAGKNNNNNNNSDDFGKKLGSFFGEVGTIGTIALVFLISQLSKNN